MKRHPITQVTIVVSLAFSCALSYVNAQDASNQFVYPEYSKRISMDFKDAQLNDVLKIFSQQSGLNFIASQDIDDKEITLFIDNVPVEEALERILYANNLTYEILPGSDIFIVKPMAKPAKELITKVYPLKYATVPSSKLNKTIAIKTDSEGAASTGAGGSEESVGILAIIEKVLTADGHVAEDPRTNSLIVTDIPSQFPIIERTISRLDVAVPQILIEVEMLDISKSTADKLGIKYGDTPLTFTGAQRDHVYPWDQNALLNKGYTFAAPEYRVGTISAAGLAATLQFLRVQTDTKYLARPRILTLNNETAEIKISTNEAIGISTQSSSAEGIGQSSVEAERVETGIFLTVTPQVNPATHEITLALSPRVIQARTGATFEGKSFKDPEERGSKSIMKVMAGETVIMGGLLRTEVSRTITKLPILGDLPVIGGAFRHKDSTESERELVIFLTPHIIEQTPVPPSMSRQTRPMLREQDIPSQRLNEIDKALSTIESQRL